MIEAHRRGEQDIVDQIVTILISYSKTALYKYTAVLKPYGYKYKELLSIWRHYVVEFIEEIEFPVDNIFSYFLGYINHRLYRIIDHEGRYKRNTNAYSDSYDECVLGYDHYVKKSEYIASDECITQWYSGNEILEGYIRNKESKILTNHEKEIIDLKLEGNSFGEISDWIGLSYRQVRQIYLNGIEKLKQFLLYHSKTLQNLNIF